MKLSETALSEFKVALALINQHEVSLKSLRNHLSSIVREETGVDVSKGSWEINPDTGELYPHTEQPNPTNEVVEGEDKDARTGI